MLTILILLVWKAVLKQQEAKNKMKKEGQKPIHFGIIDRRFNELFLINILSMFLITLFCEAFYQKKCIVKNTKYIDQ